MEQQKIFANHIYDKGFISRIYKELCTSQQQKNQSDFKMHKVLQ